MVSKLDYALSLDQFWAIDAHRALMMTGLLAEMALDVDHSELAPESPALNLFASLGGTQKGFARYRMTVLDSGIAVLPVVGTMLKRPAPSSGERTASTIALRRNLEIANQDEDVKATVLLIDSPGGQVDGLFELADVIQEHAKPIYAFVDGLCCSAALVIACRCDAIYATPYSEIGSIGTRTANMDVSANLMQKGIKIDHIANKESKYKTMGAPGTHLSAEQRQYIEEKIESMTTRFIDVLKDERGMTEAEARGLATGEVWGASESLALNLIDGLYSFNQAVDMISEGLPSEKDPAYCSQLGEPLKDMSAQDQTLASALWKAISGGGKTTADAVASADDPRLPQLLAENQELATQVATAAALKTKCQEIAPLVVKATVANSDKIAAEDLRGVTSIFEAALFADGGNTEGPTVKAASKLMSQIALREMKTSEFAFALPHKGDEAVRTGQRRAVASLARLNGGNF